MSLFIANYGRKLRMRVNIRKREKVKKVIEFAELKKGNKILLSTKDLVFKKRLVRKQK